MRKRRDPTSSHLRDLLLSGAVGQHLKLVELDLSSDMYRDVRFLSETNSQKFKLDDIGKSTEPISQNKELDELDHVTLLVHNQNEENNEHDKDIENSSLKFDNSTN